MRTSLILIMVLSLATSTQAAITLTLSSTQVAVGNTVTANIVSSDTSNWEGFFVLSEHPDDWANPVAAAIGDYGPRDPGIQPYIINPVPGYPGVLQVMAGDMSSPPQAGTQFWVSIIGVQPGTIYLDLQDGYGARIAIEPLTLVVVTPEPMTVALLGLGGLLLRRRR
jgi:hypothetical protein